MHKAAFQRPHLTDEVAEHLRQAIVAGDLLPGTAIRADSVAQELQVSATPVREALHVLRSEGFVGLIPRRGFTVLEITPDDMRDIFRARAVLAGELAARAAATAGDGDVAVLQDALDELLKAIREDPLEEPESIVHRIHTEMYRIADSRRLVWSLAALARFAPGDRFWKTGDTPERTGALYTRLIAAIRAKDPGGARAAIEEHLDNAGEAVAQAMRRR